MNTTLQISEHVKEEIIRNHIEPSYIQEISKLIKGKRDWKLVGQIFETTSKALVAIGGIVSFAAGSYGNFHLSFVAGAVSTISLATLSFSSFGYKEQKKQGVELNNLLKKLKLDEVPINERNSDDIYQAVSMRQSLQQTPHQQNEVNNLRDALYQNAKENEELRIELEFIKAKEKENEALRIELEFIKAKEKPYANDLKLLKEKLSEIITNDSIPENKSFPKPSLTRRNTPIENPDWLRRRIEELERKNSEEEKFELKVHIDNV